MKNGVLERSSIPWSTKQIIKMMDNGSLVFDNAVQRNLAWDKGRMSLLIDSMFRDYPVPSINVIKTNQTTITPKGEVSVFDCLDGKQRCHAIHAFRYNEFELTGLDPFVMADGEVDLNGCTYDTLPEEFRDIFDSFTITFYKFTNATDEDVVEIMRRLNNGKPLSTIDITRIKAKDLKGIAELGKHDLFTNCLSEKARNSRHEEDIIIKVWALLQNPNTSLDNKDVRPYYETLVINDEVKTRLTAIFDMLYAVHKHFIEIGDKSTARKVITRTHLISLSTIIDKFVSTNTELEDVFKYVDQIFGEGKPTRFEDYNDACKNGSNHAPNVIARREALEREYKWFVGDDGEDAFF